MAYIPHTDRDRKLMLERIGFDSLDDLLRTVPEAVRLRSRLDVPPAAPEWDVRARLEALSATDRHTGEMISFLGAGAYDHFIPAAIGSITRRSEFATAYTPYQAEVSQGTLQAIFEFQTAIARLVGLPVANASLYDGATATAEAGLMALAHTGGRQVVVSEAVHPYTREVLDTYLSGTGHKARIARTPDGVTDPDLLKSRLGRKPACVIVSQPNVFGQIEDLSNLAAIAHGAGALLVVIADPISLGLLEAPGKLGADIVVGEGQSLGLPLSMGGPYLGYLASTQPLVRRLPGRLVGLTTDRHGKRAYVMTLQTREQHIRRERATSNICTNQGLCALAATIYLSLVGRRGLRDIAQLCLQKAHYLADRISGLTGFRLRYTGPFFKEFVVQTPTSPGSVIRQLAKDGLLAGVDLARLQSSWRGGLLVAVTEKRSREQLDRYVEQLRPLEARAAITEALARELDERLGPQDRPDTQSESAEDARLTVGPG